MMHHKTELFEIITTQRATQLFCQGITDGIRMSNPFAFNDFDRSIAVRCCIDGGD